MKSSIHERIAEAEEKWLYLVKSHTANLFSGTFIPSHDQHHHQRVWNISKKLLIELAGINSIAGQDIVEGLLLATWFHDTGMVQDTGERHGALGSKSFRNFIKNTHHPLPGNCEEILEVIASHDTKDPSLYPELGPGKPPGIMGILSLADDMDALGTIGIYRYIEIYLKRGIPLEMLGIKILSNLRRRFRNILKSCSSVPALTNTRLREYDIIEGFFNLYNQQLLLEREWEKENRGHLGIVNSIRRFSVESRIRPENFRDQPGVSNTGGMLLTYFNELYDELEKAKH